MGGALGGSAGTPVVAVIPARLVAVAGAVVDVGGRGHHGGAVGSHDGAGPVAPGHGDVERIGEALGHALTARRYEGHHGAGLAGAAGAARAVLIVLFVVGQVVVDDELDVVDVDAAGSHVGGDEHLHLAALEVLEGAAAGGLRAGAVQRPGADAGIHERSGDVIDAEPGLHEHDRGAVPVDELDGGIETLHRRLDHEPVLHLTAVLLAHQVVHRRIAQVLAHQLVDVAVEGGRPQHGLAAGGGHVEDLAHVGHEAQVGHAVGLVDHAHLDRAEVAVALLDDVEQAARGGHDDGRALLQRVDLGGHRRTPVHGLDEAPLGAAQRHECTLHLLGELTCGHQHETGGPVRLGLAHACEQRDAEAEGLARAGGGPAAEIAPGEGVGEGDGLDGECLGHAGGSECLGHARGHAEIDERCGHGLLSCEVRCSSATAGARLQPSTPATNDGVLNKELHT